MKNILFLLLSGALFLSACSTDAVTGRRQLSLISENTLQQEAGTQYRAFLSQNKVVTDPNNANLSMVKRVGNRLAAAITQYYRSKNLTSELSHFQWEFNLVDSKELNAWAMPGGKVVIYTGLLPVTQNETGLAIVMGHEITHIVAHHGQERISQAMVAQGIGVGASVFTAGNPQAANVFNNIYGPAAQVGVLLPNSRKQELEGDRFGLMFAAMAGYDPREAVPFWTRMASMSGGGQKPPPFLSTHPTDADRIQKIKDYMPEALKYYKLRS